MNITQHYYRTYWTNWCSCTQLVYFISLYLTVALPFYFCFGGSNFWLKQKYVEMQIQYNYTGYYAMLINFKNESATQISNIPTTFLNFGENQNILIMVDDQFNSTSVQINISESTQNMNLLLYFNITIPSLQKSISSALQINIFGECTSAYLSGVMSLHMNQPINKLMDGRNVNSLLQFPNNIEPQNFSQLITALTNSQYHLRLQSYIQMQGQDSQTKSFNFNSNIDKQKQVMVAYYPSILQTFKFSYSTYLAFLITSYLFFRNLFVAFADQGAIECNKHDEVTK